MDHANHDAGTEPECMKCRAVAYEPGWYAMLQRLSQSVEEAETYFVPPPPIPSFA
jgi:hypothetical protein